MNVGMEEEIKTTITSSDQSEEKILDKVKVEEKTSSITEDEQENDIGGYQPPPVLTPEKEAQRIFFIKSGERQDVFKKIGKMILWGIPIFLTLLMGLATFYLQGYFSTLKDLIAPISAQNEKNKTYDKDINEINNDIKILEDRIYNLIDKRTETNNLEKK